MSCICREAAFEKGRDRHRLLDRPRKNVPNLQQAYSGMCVLQKKAIPKGDGIVRAGRETKGRKGKGITVITGVPLDEPGLKELARQLKEMCGAGGTLKDGVIEIQGDHREVLLEELKRRGWTAELVGGQQRQHAGREKLFRTRGDLRSLSHLDRCRV